MIRKCCKDCVEICGFCSKYNTVTEKCKYSKKHKELFNDCDCKMFECFTLDKNYNKDDYLDYKYIKKLFEGEVD